MLNAATTPIPGAVQELALVGGWWLVGLAPRMLGRVLRARKLEDTLVGFLISIAMALLMTIVIVSVLGALGIPTTSLAAVIGAGGLASGLALQGTLSNFASGVMLICFRPFRAGDLVGVALQDPPSAVAVSELADSSVNFVVRPWCKADDYWDVWFSVTEDIKLALDAACITIPYPQRDEHMENVA